MDRGSENMSPFKERDNQLNDDLYRRFLGDLYQYVRCDNIVAAKDLVKNSSREYRQIFIKQHDTVSLDPLIFYTIRNSSLDTLKFVVDECKVNINEPIWFDGSLLCRKNKSRNSLDGNICSLSPLQYAIHWYFCSLENIKFLVDRGADVNSTTSTGLSCLMLAADDRLDVCEFLIEKGANVNSVSNFGETALHFAVGAKCYRCVKLLVKRGAFVESSSNNGVTSLMLAAARDFWIFQFLVNNGANIFVADEMGKTAFEYAESANQTRIMMLLVEKGVDPFHVDKHGAKRIAAAYSRGDEWTVNALLNALSLSANTSQLKQIEKHHRLISCYKLRWNSIKPFKAFNKTVSRTRPTLENLQRDLELGLELTSELFGTTHCRFYDAIHKAATCFLKAAFYDQWLRQLTYNFETFCSPDLNIHDRCTELGRMLDEMQNRVEFLYGKRNTLSFLDFGVFDDLLRTIIDEAAKCSLPDKTLIDLILILIRLALFVGFDDQKRQSFRNLVYRAVKLQSLTRIKYKFLLPSLRMPFWWYSTCVMPNIVALLLECGADVDERDENGNNAVHFLSQSPSYAAFIDKDFASIFLKYGIHLDVRNHEGLETSSCLQKFGIELESSIYLKCLAARAIRRFNIPTSGKIPAQLVHFVEMH